MWFRKKRVTDASGIEVQLHRVDNHTGEVLYSWKPINVGDWEEAWIQAKRLRQDNLWGSPDYHPRVTIAGVTV